MVMHQHGGENKSFLIYPQIIPSEIALPSKSMRKEEEMWWLSLISVWTSFLS